MSTAAVWDAPPGAWAVADNEEQYEIIDGQRIEVPPMSAFATIVASNLFLELGTHLKERQRGQAVMEVLFHLAKAGRNRRPDVAFVSYDRWPKGQSVPPRDNAWDVTPDLAVEIISPIDLAVSLIEKLQDYFESGVRQVWVIFPESGHLHLYRSLTDIEVLSRDGVLRSDDLLPEFSVRLSELLPAVGS